MKFNTQSVCSIVLAALAAISLQSSSTASEVEGSIGILSQTESRKLDALLTSSSPDLPSVGPFSVSRETIGILPEDESNKLSRLLTDADVDIRPAAQYVGIVGGTGFGILDKEKSRRLDALLSSTKSVQVVETEAFLVQPTIGVLDSESSRRLDALLGI